MPESRSVRHTLWMLYELGSKMAVKHTGAVIGLPGEEKNLGPMNIAGTITDGNYFPMAGNGPFRIPLTIRIPGRPGEITTEFEHRHQLGKNCPASAFMRQIGVNGKWRISGSSGCGISGSALAFGMDMAS